MNSDKKLAAYSIMSLCYLSANNNLNAQAVYSDINPDTILESLITEAFDLDLNLDGTSDLEFVNNGFTWLSVYNRNALVFPEDKFSIAGEIGYFSEYYPSALSAGFLIESGIPFYENFIQVLAHRHYYIDWSFYYLFYDGLWYPEKIDHYLGIRFLDADTCMHYGWIRCDVLDEGRKLIIKDYAYESRCNTGIAAGDTVGFKPEIILDSTIIIHPDEIISNDLTGVSAYSFNGKVFIQLPDQNPTYHLKIIGLKGDILYEKDLFNLVNEITVPLNNSIILIQLQSEGKFYTKKIFL